MADRLDLERDSHNKQRCGMFCRGVFRFLSAPAIPTTNYVADWLLDGYKHTPAQYACYGRVDSFFAGARENPFVEYDNGHFFLLHRC